MKKLLIILAGALIMNACSNELDVFAPYQDIPVVYGILNAADSVQYIKLRKAFVGAQNAYEMAEIGDSTHYEGAVCYLEELSEDDYYPPVMRIDFHEEQMPKDTGIFDPEKNIIFQSDYPLNPYSKYRLHIDLPNGKELISTTRLINNLRIYLPRYKQIEVNLNDTVRPFKVGWYSTPNGYLYQLVLRFHYIEVKGNEFTNKHIDWTFSTVQLDKPPANGERPREMFKEIRGESFYRFLMINVPKEPEVDYRIIGGFDLVLIAGGEELQVLEQIKVSEFDMINPIYSNVQNAIGLFSTRFQLEEKGYSFDLSTRDSIQKSQYTKKLKFREIY